jgi:molybdate transport system substrate-binding protein
VTDGWIDGWLDSSTNPIIHQSTFNIITSNANRRRMQVRTLLIAALGGLAMAALPACQKQPATPEAVSPSGAPREGTQAPVTPGAQGAPAGAWKLEFGPSDAKVVVECFYPTEGHEWVAELNKKILAAYPSQVRILHINWQTDSGLREMEAKKLEPCGQYLIDGQIAVKKNRVLGNWKDEDLLNAVKKAVQAKYGSAAVRAAADLTVFVPCGLAGPFGDLRQQFAKERPDIKLIASVGNTIVLRDRIAKGERADVFLCMGDLELEPLKAKQKIRPDSAKTIAATSVSLITPLNNPGEIKGLKDLTGAKVRRIALGEPDGISVGAQAVKALTHFGIWDNVKDRAYFVKEAATLKIITADGKVDAAFVYTSCLDETHAPGTQPEKFPLHTVCEVPTEMYTAVPIVGVVLADSAAPEAAQQFIDFCATPDAHKVFVKWKFLRTESRNQAALSNAR